MNKNHWILNKLPEISHNTQKRTTISVSQPLNAESENRIPEPKGSGADR